MSGRRLAVDRQQPSEPARRLFAISAGKLGRRCRPARKAGVPSTVGFRTKPRIALDQLAWACTSGLPRGDVIADAGYGAEERFRAGITELGLRYIVGVKSTNAVWAGIEAGSGAADMRLSVEKLALALSDDTWRTISWREGTNENLSGQFARVRVRAAPLDA